jgi:hypothetical protein
MLAAEVTGLFIMLGIGLGLLILAGAVFVMVAFIVFAALKLVLLVLLLPFRIVGWGLKLGFTVIGILVRGFFLIAVCAILILAGMLPLVPLVVIFAGIYYLVKALRPRPVPPIKA